eukprot:5102343-Pyramimonas_sp.AAC.1
MQIQFKTCECESAWGRVGKEACCKAKQPRAAFVTLYHSDPGSSRSGWKGQVMGRLWGTRRWQGRSTRWGPDCVQKLHNACRWPSR